MNLSEIQNLSIDAKRRWLLSPEGLSQLEQWLLSGNSLPQIAQMMGVDKKTVYRWSANYPEIAEIVAPYTPVRATKVEPAVDLSKEAAYRIIYAYDDIRPNINGFIWDEYLTAEDAWDNLFIRQYFESFNNSDTLKYRENYLAAIKSIGCYKLSNWYLIAYCTVTKKGLIKPRKPPV